MPKHNSSLILYNYFRSSAAFRVRTALNWKQLPYEEREVHLVKNGGEQNTPEYLRLNPMGEVPCLVHNGVAIGQSVAIFEYLDSVFAGPRLFPTDPVKKAKVLQIVESVNSGIHPIQNLKVLNRLTDVWGATVEQRNDWARHWISRGFTGLEQMLARSAGTYSFGGEITAADMFLVPQYFNALRYQVDLTGFPILSGVCERALKLSAFDRARPENQAGYTK